MLQSRPIKSIYTGYVLVFSQLNLPFQLSHLKYFFVDPLVTGVTRICNKKNSRLDFFSSPTVRKTSKQPMTAQLLYYTLLPFSALLL